MTSLVDMRRIKDVLFSTLIPSMILLDLLIAPYTKVEESFNIQATHDILKYRIPWRKADADVWQKYDHLTFSGSVPRTFVGPIALAGASKPFIWLAEKWLGELTTGRQIIIRAVLGLFNAICLISFKNGVARTFGRDAANWYAVFQAGQFHMMYYASRTLPNFFAFGLTTLASRNLLPYAARGPLSRKHQAQSALILLTVAGIVFRSEIAVILACNTLYVFLAPHIRLPLSSIIPAGIWGLVLGLGLTVPIDTFFWRSTKLLWPELSGFIYNVVEGKSENWGTEPWSYYFLSALPRLLFNPIIYIICIPFTILLPSYRRDNIDILLPAFSFVAIYSFQPHKEWRFIVYIIPPLLALASAGASWIWIRRSKKIVYQILSLALLTSTLASFVASLAMLKVSSLNYPGADALNRLHGLALNDSGVRKVHMDTLACMTGVTHFIEQDTPSTNLSAAISWQGLSWIYDKTEDAERLLDPLFWEDMDYAIAERPENVLGQWFVIDIVSAFGGIRLARTQKDDIPDYRGLLQGAWSSGEGLLEEGKTIWRDSGSLPAIVARSGDILDQLLGSAQSFLQQRITQGWWLKVKMEPRLYILSQDRKIVKESESLCNQIPMHGSE